MLRGLHGGKAWFLLRTGVPKSSELMLLRSPWNCERSAHQGPRPWGPEKRGPTAPPLSSRLSLAAAGKGQSQLVRSWAAAAPSPCLSGERASEGRLTRGCPWWLFHSLFCRHTQKPAQSSCFAAGTQNRGAVAFAVAYAAWMKSGTAFWRSSAFSWWTTVRKEVLQECCHKSRALGAVFIYL